MHDVLETILRTLWGSMFPHLEPLRPTERAPGAAERELTASVGFTGSWRGRLVLSCSEALGRALVSAWYRRPAEDDGELLDLLGELANVAGGNLGATLHGAQMSLPTVVRDGSDPLAGDDPAAHRLVCEAEHGLIVMELVPE